MSTILDRIICNQVAKQKQLVRSYETGILKPGPRRQPLEFVPVLEKRFSVIAEVKKGSPSLGIIRQDFDHKDIAVGYKAGGAAAVSIVTEEDFFFGRPEFLPDIRQLIDLPLLRKDFIIHPAQIYESYNLGADIILLIAACLDRRIMKELASLASELGMTVLFEVHDLKQLKQVLQLNPRLIGINNRDLSTFKVNLGTSLSLIKEIPDNISVISESGIKSHSDIAQLREAGFAGALVGESLLLKTDVAEALKELLYGE